MFNFNKSNGQYGVKLLSLLDEELERRSVTGFVNSGTTKVVFENKDREIVKVVVFDDTSVKRFMKEPIELKVNKECNTPREILLISSEDHKYSVLDRKCVTNIGSYCALVWTEDCAPHANLINFPADRMEEARQWFARTSS